ncbi:hypothetical protein MNEG_10123, partial [Monoraphidium neglectum]
MSAVWTDSSSGPAAEVPSAQQGRAASAGAHNPEAGGGSWLEPSRPPRAQQQVQ